MLQLPEVFAVKVAVAVGVGALIGIEREQSESAGGFAGSRTFVLIAVYGGLVQEFFPELLPVALLTLTIPVTVAYVSKIVIEDDAGMTTAVVTLLTFVYGAMATHSERGMRYAVVLATLTTVLLALKDPLHRFANRIEKEERRAMLKFLVLALVVYPLLPDKELEILSGVNPRFILLMVIFISGISLFAYVLTRIVGVKKGIGVTGFLGGLVSSTATSISMSERASANHNLSHICGFSIALASIVMFPRAL
ncbi:MAG: DUF4010 domain-containing protein, partial [Halobacteria archaeon]|nr:DUF4010 domain-containing protein [Halobacteria archaeon]